MMHEQQISALDSALSEHLAKLCEAEVAFYAPLRAAAKNKVEGGAFEVVGTFIDQLVKAFPALEREVACVLALRAEIARLRAEAFHQPTVERLRAITDSAEPAPTAPNVAYLRPRFRAVNEHPTGPEAA